MIKPQDQFEEIEDHHLPERCAKFRGEPTRVAYKVAQIVTAPQGMIARFRFLDTRTGAPTSSCGSTAVPALGIWEEWDQLGTRRVSRRRRGAGPLLLDQGALVPLPEFVARWAREAPRDPIQLMGCEIAPPDPDGLVYPVGSLLMYDQPAPINLSAEASAKTP